MFVWSLLCVFVSPSIVCVDLLFLQSVTRLLLVSFLLSSHYEPPEISSSGGKRAVDLNVRFTFCSLQPFNEKPKLRIVSLISDYIK